MSVLMKFKKVDAFVLKKGSSKCSLIYVRKNFFFEKD